MSDSATLRIDVDVDRSFREACAEIDVRVRKGETRIAERWADTEGPLADDTDRLVELIFTEFATREAHGQTPTPDEYYARFPQLAERLRRLFDVDDLLKTEEAFAGGPQSGRHVGAYEIREKLGSGGMGVVYRGWHPVLRREVAIKLLGPLAGEGSDKRFLREGRAIASLNHPNIVHLYEVGEQAGQPFLAMEYVSGGSLRDRLAGHLLPPVEAATLIATLADAIHYAHSQGIIHRDLKPGNVLLSRDDGVPKVADFGLATRLDQTSVSMAGNAVGTPSYMAPEQAEGKAPYTAAVDVYALGAILYEALIGRPPFLGDSTAETLLKVIHDEPVPLRQVRPEIPRDLETICLKCLNKPQGRRYASAEALAQDLRRFLNHDPILARAIGPVERSIRFAKKRPVLSVALSIVALALVVMVIGWAEFTRQLRHEATETADQRDRANEHRDRADALRDASDILRDKAVAERQIADTEREKAVALLAANREYQFVTRIMQASSVYRSNPFRGRELLASPDWCPPERRDFIWHYLNDTTKVERFEVNAKTTGLNVMAVSSDGKQMLIGGADGTVAGYATDLGKQLFRHEKAHAAPVSAVAFSFDCKMAISASIDGVVHSWEIGKEKPGRKLGEMNVPIYAIAVSPDGIVFAGGGRKGVGGTIQAWELANGQVKLAPPKETAVVRSLCMAPDGDSLVIGTDRGEVARWSISKSLIGPRFRTQAFRVQNLAVRADGMIAVAGLGRNEVTLWEGSTGRKLQTIEVGRGIWSVQFSPEGRTLAIGEQASRLSIYRVADGQFVTSVIASKHRRENVKAPILFETSLAGENPNLIAGVAFSAEDRVVTACADNSIMGWSLDTAPRATVGPVHPHASMHQVAIDEGRGAIAMGNDRRLVRYNLETGESTPLTEVFPSTGSMLTLARDGRSMFMISSSTPVEGKTAEWIIHAGQAPDFSRRDQINVAWPIDALIPGADNSVYIVGRDGRILLWKAHSSEPPKEIGTHPGKIIQGVYLPTLDKLVTLSAGVSVVWPENRRLQTVFAGIVRGAELSPDGKTVAVYTMGGADPKAQLYLWDAANDQPPRVLDAGRNNVVGVCFSPDGHTLAVAGADRRIHLANVASGDELLTLSDEKELLRNLIFSKDGKQIRTFRVRANPAETRIVTWKVGGLYP